MTTKANKGIYLNLFFYKMMKRSIVMDDGSTYDPIRDYKQITVNRWLHYTYTTTGMLNELGRIQNIRKEKAWELQWE